ncbi:MAG: hypothetical protein ACRCUI_02085 [Polymorphobacter sp.]
MRTIKIILLSLSFAVFVAFTLFNWSDVDILLGPWSVLIKKPVLLLLAFLAGFLPTYLMHIASRTTWRRKLARAEKAVTEAVIDRAQPVAVEPVSIARPGALP